MKIALVKIEKFCGPKASFYTVTVDDKRLFESFISENSPKYDSELMDVLGRIRSMAFTIGAQKDFFKTKESEDPNYDKIVALYDKPDSRLRIYAAWQSDKLVVLGGGGPKSKSIIRWQESKKLSSENRLIKQISDLIDKKLESGDLRITGNGLDFVGNLTIKK